MRRCDSTVGRDLASERLCVRVLARCDFGLQELNGLLVRLDLFSQVFLVKPRPFLRLQGLEGIKLGLAGRGRQLNSLRLREVCKLLVRRSMLIDHHRAELAYFGARALVFGQLAGCDFGLAALGEFLKKITFRRMRRECQARRSRRSGTWIGFSCVTPAAGAGRRRGSHAGCGTAAVHSIGTSSQGSVSQLPALPGIVDAKPANWSGQRDLNPRPSAPKADALPDCAMPRRAGIVRRHPGAVNLPSRTQSSARLPSQICSF